METPEQVKIEALEDMVSEVKTDTKEILKVLNGVVTKVALNNQSINRLWWWVGSVSVGILGLCFFVVRSNLLE